MKQTGANWAFISFPGGGERIAALLGGHVDIMIIEPSEAGEQVRAGKLRCWRRSARRRLETFKDVPTLKEAGFDFQDIPQTRGIVGPPGMPAEAVKYYEDFFDKLRKTAGWKKFLADNQLLGVEEKSDASKTFLETYEDMLRVVLKDAGAKVVR